MLTRPSYIPASVSSAVLDFNWSSEIARRLDDFDALPGHLADAVEAVNYRGKMGLGLVCLEWVLWRLSGHTDVSDGLKRIEAAWASQVSILYSNNLDYLEAGDAAMTQGNPDAPLESALLRLESMHFGFTKGKTQMISESVRCATLASHVLPESSGFEPWLQSTLTALGQAYPCGPDYDRRAKTFDHSGEPPIPRAWFESLTVPPDVAADRAAWDLFLRGLNPADNPHLVPVDKLRAAGFVGEPYRMD